MHNQEQAFQYADLILRHLKGELDSEETIVFQDWLDSDIRNKKFVESLRNENDLNSQIEFFYSLDTENAWKNIISSRESNVKLLSIWKYAAAVILICFSTAIVWYSSYNNQKAFVAKVSSKQYPDIKPGTNKATLTLSDGSVIELDENSNGVVSNSAGIKISKKNGRLIYQVLDVKKTGNEIFINTISTPRGGQYQVLLPDGTEVWLNAFSSLSFPTSFKGKERIVKLKGEGYFEVAKNKKMSFSVLVGSAEVKVLGTHFNINSYTEENDIRTTLFEGSVKVKQGNNSLVIAPGQQARINRTSEGIDVSEADIDETLAWKNGIFLFNNETIPMVMRQIGRWYDVDVDYEGKVPDMHFTGKISRHTDVSKILNLLELTGGVHFNFDNRKITVYNNPINNLK